MKPVVQILGALICGSCLIGCAGPKQPAYQTELQKFTWGSAYVWMSTLQVSQRNATSGEGYLLINTAYNKSVLNKHCAITVKHVSMTVSDTGAVLIDGAPSSNDGSPLTKDITGTKTGQISLRSFPFEFDRDSFPHDLNIKMNITCPNIHSEHEFSKKIEFFMRQPVIWMQ